MTSYQILDYNRPDLVQNAVRSILYWAPPPHEIVVLENGSAASAAACMLGPHVRVLHTGKNLGYQAGHNYLALRADPRATEFVVLDNDMFFSVSSAQILTETVRANPYAFACVRQISGFDTPLFNTNAPEIQDLHEFSKRYPGQACAPVDHPTLPFCVSREGWEALTNFDVWNNACLEHNRFRGAFDEWIDPTQRGWHSDWDVFNRARLLGMPIQAAGAYAYHYHHATLCLDDKHDPTWVQASEQRYDLKYGSRTAKVVRDGWVPKPAPPGY